MSLWEALRGKIESLPGAEQANVGTSISDEDRRGADELGIPVSRYVMWKDGFHEAYVIHRVGPVEADIQPETIRYADNPGMRRAIPRGETKYTDRKDRERQLRKKREKFRNRKID